MSDLLDPEICAFEAQDFAAWLKAGLLIYSGAERLPADMRMPDAFRFAELFIGRNERDILEDLKDVHQALPPPVRVEFERGVRLAWAELEFRETYELAFAQQLLILACRLRSKAIVQSLPGALPWLAATGGEGESKLRLALQLRKLAFQASIELAASSTESVLCIEKFIIDASFDEPILERAQALTIVNYLAMNAADRLPYWCAIFGDYIVNDIDHEIVSEKQVREGLEEAYGVEEVQRVIDMVRIDKISRLATERTALTEPSMDGLYNLVSRIDSANAGGGYRRTAVTLGWDALREGPTTATADVIQIAEWRAG
jgi:hypothetical protein